MIKPIKHIGSIDIDGKEGVHFEIIDENKNDIPDGAERKAKDNNKEISGYAGSEDSALERILRFGRKFIAGENKVGKAGGVVKDVLKRFVPFGREIDSVTDAIGDSLKDKSNTNTMAEQSGLLTWLKARLKEPSTYQGIVAILAVVGVSVDPEIIKEASALAVSLIGFIQVIKRERNEED